jgi:uncharacterized protein YjbI with pentapeptide repeats
MEVPTAYARENARLAENRKPNSVGATRITADIQAILTVLGRRERTYRKGEDQRLNLNTTKLRGAVLNEAKLQGAILGEVNQNDTTTTLPSSTG